MTVLIDWTKYASNPVLDLGEAETWDDVHAYRSFIIQRGSTFYMFFNGFDGSDVRIGLATSTDLITWTKYASNPVLDLGAGGTWDDKKVQRPLIVQRGSTYYMFYGGHDGDDIRIGFATSTDLITWTKYASNPVLDLGDADTWDDKYVYRPFIIQRRSTFYMFYSGFDGTNVRIGLATSTDLITWTKYASNPVLDLGAGATWEDKHVYRLCIIQRGSTYYMFYSGHDGTNIKTGFATSTDLITWTKYASNPVLDLGVGGTWDDEYAYEPFIIQRGSTFYMFYTGQDGANERIGYAVSS